METWVVSSAPGRAVYRDTLRRDGTKYEITVFANASGLYGTWQCAACGVTGVSPVFRSSKEEAIDLATVGLDKHHAQNHSGSIVG